MKKFNSIDFILPKLKQHRHQTAKEKCNKQVAKPNYQFGHRYLSSPITFPILQTCPEVPLCHPGLDCSCPKGLAKSDPVLNRGTIYSLLVPPPDLRAWVSRHQLRIWYLKVLGSFGGLKAITQLSFLSELNYKILLFLSSFFFTHQKFLVPKGFLNLFTKVVHSLSFQKPFNQLKKKLLYHSLKENSNF